MKKYLIVGLVLTTMFAGVACGSNAQVVTVEKLGMIEDAKAAMSLSEYDKARNLFKLASDEETGENKDLAMNSYELLSSFILAQKALGEKNIEEARVHISKIENDTMYPNLVEDIKKLKGEIEAEESKDKELDEKFEVINSLVKEENLEQAQKVFAEIKIEGLSAEANKKYGNMSFKIKELEEKVAEKKKAEQEAKKIQEAQMIEKEAIFNGTKIIHIRSDEDSKFENYKIIKLEGGALEVEVNNEWASLKGSLRQASDTAWTGTLYDSALGIDSFYDFTITDDAVKITQTSDANVRTLTLYLKSKTYKEENTNINSVQNITGEFVLK
ncbi:MAG: hypothetical protein ACRCTZ_07495 [Sarcina sp.]